MQIIGYTAVDDINIITGAEFLIIRGAKFIAPFAHSQLPAGFRPGGDSGECDLAGDFRNRNSTNDRHGHAFCP